MRDFQLKKIVSIVGLGLLVYTGIYLSMTMGSAFQGAKSYVESNEDVVKSVGPIKVIMMTFFGNSSSRTREANFEISVLGEDSSGQVHIKMTNQAEGWRVINATLVTRENSVVILKEDKLKTE